MNDAWDALVETARRMMEEEAKRRREADSPLEPIEDLMAEVLVEVAPAATAI